MLLLANINFYFMLKHHFHMWHYCYINFIEQILLKSVFTGYMYSQITLISKLRTMVEFHAWVTVVFYSKWKNMVIFTDFPARGPGMYML